MLISAKGGNNYCFDFWQMTKHNDYDQSNNDKKPFLFSSAKPKPIII